MPGGEQVVKTTFGDPMFRRTTAALALSTLAFTGVAAAPDTSATAGIDGLTVSVVDGVLTVTGTPTFSGGEAVLIADGDGGDFAPGIDIVSATIQQDGDLFLATMEVTGSVAPGALYSIPLGVSGAGDNRLFAYANAVATAEFQVANFDDGYTSTGITGTMSGSTITWEAPLAAIGAAPGAKITMGAAPVEASFGVSSSACCSLNGTAAGGLDTAAWIADSYMIGGGMKVQVVGGDVDETVKAKVRRGVAAAAIDDLAPGTYEVTVSTGFADATWSQTFTVTI